MKSYLVALLGLLLVISNGVATGAQSVKSATVQGEKTQQALREAEQKWLDAYYDLDVGALDASESDDFTMITPNAITAKQEQVSHLRELTSSSGRSTSPAKFELSNQKFQIYGNIAIVSDICSIYGGSITSPGRYWQTEVWRSDKGKWKIVHLHVSMVAHRM
jgi:ketosteroid isomerase-like protein